MRRDSLCVRSEIPLSPMPGSLTPNLQGSEPMRSGIMVDSVCEIVVHRHPMMIYLKEMEKGMRRVNLRMCGCGK
jgi:hypothetical protein